MEEIGGAVGARHWVWRIALCCWALRLRPLRSCSFREEIVIPVLRALRSLYGARAYSEGEDAETGSLSDDKST